MSSNFKNILVQSFFTILESTLSIDKIIERALSNNDKYVVLTDKNLYGSIEFYYKSKKNNLIPIIGLQVENKNSKLLLIAKNNDGYHNLVKIHSMTNLDQEFEIYEYLSNLFVILLEGEKIDNYSDIIDSSECAINLVSSIDSKDAKLLTILKAIKTEQKLCDVKDNFDNNFFLNDIQAEEKFSKHQIEKNNEILEQCNWVLETADNRLPIFPTPKDVDSKIFLENMCVMGLSRKIGSSGSFPKNYMDRLFYELGVIDKMGFNDYFLIVQDFVNFAKKNDILVGPGRGSAAGSLVAYSLNITDVDPIKNNLIFERFLNPERKSLPDIDIDVMDTRRQEVIDYIFNKYGPSNTSYIITFQYIKAKMALRDIGRILSIDIKIIDRISKLLTPEMESNLLLCKDHYTTKQFFSEFTELFELSNLLVGVPRQISTHAAGIIIADKPLYEYIPVEAGIDKWQLSQYTMEHLEKLGLFKIDILGLKNLSIIKEVVDLIKVTQAKIIDLSKIDLNDKNLFNEMTKANTIGIFQLESPGMSNTLRKIKPKNIEDISITSALFRPGPQAFINDYAKTRDGLLEEKYISDELKPFLKPTLGFCIYQEQVIEIIKHVANFSTSDADVFRRAISKKDASIFNEMKSQFLKGAAENNVDLANAEKIYNYLVDFGNYGFNHSHSLAYSYISYQMMYLKYYFPLEFHLVLLRYSDSSNGKNNLYISELKKYSVPISNVSILNSNHNFDIYQKSVIFGFSNIKGFGNQISSKILEARNTYKFKSWKDSISILGNVPGIGKKVLEILILCGAFDEFNLDRNFLLLNLDEIIKKGNIAHGDLFPLELSNDYTPMTEEEKSEWEYKLLSYSFSNNKWEELFNRYEKINSLSKITSTSENFELDTVVKITNIKKTMTKFNKAMAFIEFSSNDVDYSCACFSPEIFDNIVANNYFICKIKSQNGKLQLLKIINKITE
ncbi:MAG: DNA polymerase III subunit alpha [Mycoplasma sp.]